MDIRTERSWMYDRLYPGRKGLKNEFIVGVEQFISLAMQLPSFVDGGMIRCPCSHHKNMTFLEVEEVKVDLYRKGFLPDYWYWTSHGEIEPHIDFAAESSFMSEAVGVDSRNFEEMIMNTARSVYVEDVVDEQPNESAQQFYDLLEAAQRPLWEGCTTHTELSVALKMLSIKTEYNIPRACFDQYAVLLKETNPQENLVPQDLYRTKKLVSKLGLNSIKIDCCINDCMLFYKENSADTECRFCKAPRFKPRSRKQKNLKDVPQKRLFYLPITPRLQRLYASMRSASHMQWHFGRPLGSQNLCHPADGYAWQHFDEKYPEFSAEPRNVRLGLCSDGFTPYGQSASPYSCWPVMITPYNLPPELCMTSPYIFLSLIIPGPKNPKAKIDVYLQPLIEELTHLWEFGVLTYDVASKKNFQMKAALLWTINDFPAYGMLSGWSTAGKLACPICMDSSKSFRLKNGRKNSWFDCHRQFLPQGHTFRRNKDSFIKNRVEKDKAPVRLSGSDVFNIISELPKISDVISSENPIDGYGVHHNWIKQSIFWELPYWKDNLIRHNIDVMHTEKNFFDNIFNTVMDVVGKSKDNINSRRDLKDLCKRRELELIERSDGKVLKPKAKYSLTLEQRRVICEWVKSIRMPYGYASNLTRCVDVQRGLMFGMKSHDCHIFLQCLLPVAFSALPDEILNPLVEISLFFKELTSTNLSVDGLQKLQCNIAEILCKLERIFPPSFFDSMEHLPIHLPYEAIVGGPVQYRWMYPFERFLNKLKKTVKNKAHPEGSICEAYLAQETTNFCSYYFETSTSVNQGDGCSTSRSTLSIFKGNGKTSGSSSYKYLSDKELKAVIVTVLNNTKEVQPFLELFINSMDSNDNSFIDRMIEEQFPAWFRNYVHNPENCVDNVDLHDLAWGPNRRVRIWPICEVNGYKFHTHSRSEGRKTYNAGVSIKATAESIDETTFYGIIEEIVEVEYPGENERTVILFSCQWFDPSPRGTRKHKYYEITEVKRTRRYMKYDPFILSEQAAQVYYLSYPGRIRDKIDWSVVVKIKPRATVEVHSTIESAHQEEEMEIHNFAPIEDTIVQLLDDNAQFEDISGALGDNNDEDELEENFIDSTPSDSSASS